MDELTANHVTEWKVAMENARHFNDLLIRFRMSGLTVVITLSLAGIASHQFVGNIQLWAWALPLTTLVITIFAWVALAWHTVQKVKRRATPHVLPELPLFPIEFGLWAIFVAFASYFTCNIICRLVSSTLSLSFGSVAAYSITPIALLVAVVLLIALYVMDRFYYYKLLIGAVTRLGDLEEELHFEITAITNRAMPLAHATNLVTFFYALPGIILLIISCTNLSA